MSAHAKFSPSGASIWLNCPASLRLSEGMPDTTNEASGTLGNVKVREVIADEAGGRRVAKMSQQERNCVRISLELLGVKR